MELRPRNTDLPWLDGFVDENGRKFGRSKSGYVNFGDISRSLLNQQCQYASRYIDGHLEGYPSLGDGLRIEGDSADYHSLAVHPEDAEELAGRILIYRTLECGYVEENEEVRGLTKQERLEGESYLAERGLPVPTQ